MWLVSVKEGRASLRVVGSGVLRSMLAMLGRKRITFAVGYRLRVSCSSTSWYQAMT